MNGGSVKGWPEFGSRGGIRRDPPETGPGTALDSPGWARGIVLYCVYPRAFSAEGSLEAVRARLSEIRDLGADALWILPIHPSGVVGRKGRLGSPYAIRDYLSVDPEYGSEEDFRRLVREAHASGLKVLLDMVLNHASLDHQAPAPDWFHRDRLGRRTRRIKAWADVADWNYASRDVRNHLLRVMEHWIRTCDIDGYRCDVAGMVPADFWIEARERLLALKPDHLLLAEWDDPALHRTSFHVTYDWELYRNLVKVRESRATAPRLAHLLERRHAAFPAGAQPLRFVENHDEPRVVRRFGSAAFAVTAFTALSGGLFLVYNGQEIGARIRPGLFERQPIEWSRAGSKEARREMKELLALRSRLHMTGPPAAVPAGRSPRVAAYRRTRAGGGSVIVALNLSGRFLPVVGELRDWTANATPVWPDAARKGGEMPLPPRSTVVWQQS